jgi:hypothetical protein
MSELPTKMESAYNADELGHYQAVSMTAVFALLLGMCSPLALLSPLLVLIPVLAVVAAMIALSKLRVAGSGLTGARLARIGLVMAIIFGVACCTRIVVINILVNRARAVATPLAAPPVTAASDVPTENAISD